LRAAARRGNPFRLVVLDANMPGMDGFSVAESIQADASLTGQDLIMLTSGGQRGEAARCRQVGISAYLTKPTRRSELLDVVMTVLHPAIGAGRRGGLITRHSLREERRRLRVLLVEDNPVNRAVAARLLERRGQIVTIARNGREAVDLIKARPFDVALMDLQMPEMDGLEATAAIRASEEGTGRRLPIVAMTAHAMKGDRERCLRAGMDAYVSKPIQAGDLFEAIDAATGATSGGAGEPDAPGPATSRGKGVVDRAALLSRLEGDASLLTEIVGLFLQTAPRLMRDLKQALTSKDAGKLERAAHTLKGAVANFGARPAFEAAFKMEQHGQRGDLAAARKAWASVEKEMARLKKELERLAEEHAA